MWLSPAVLFILTLLYSASALAQTSLAYDVSPPDYQCPGGPRNCYIPSLNAWGPVNPAVGGPSVTHAYIQFTLPVTQTVEIYFDALFFLSPGGSYTPGVGIDGFDAAHLCPQFQGGVTDDNAGINLSQHSRAICIIDLAAGPHTVYAMEYGRAGASAFRGAPNQALIVRR